MNRKLIKILFISSIALIIGCAGAMGNFKKIVELQDTLSKKFNTKNIKVNVTNGRYLTVSLINTTYNDSLPEIQQKVAIEIGKIVIDVYKSDSTIESGSVLLVNNSNYLVVNTSKSVSYDMKIDSLLTAIKNDTIK